MAARAGGAPFWGTQALPGRVGSGRGRGWAAAPSLLRPAPPQSPPWSPVPCTLHPLPPLPPAGSCFTSPPLGPQEPAARGEDGGGSAGSSGCGIQYGGNESSRVAPRSAAPASAPPGGWPARLLRPRGNHRGVLARASPPGGPAARALGRPAPGPPPRARPTRERALQPSGARRPALGGQCRALLGTRTKRPHKAASLGNNVVTFVLFPRGLAPLHERLGLADLQNFTG